jgi:hypothetical protein
VPVWTTISCALAIPWFLLTLLETRGGWAGNVEEEFVKMNESGYTLAKVSDNKEFEVTTSKMGHPESLTIPLPGVATR